MSFPLQKLIQRKWSSKYITYINIQGDLNKLSIYIFLIITTVKRLNILHLMENKLP